MFSFLSLFSGTSYSPNRIHSYAPSSRRRALLAAASSGTTPLAGCSSLNPFTDESTDVRSIDGLTRDADEQANWNVAEFEIEDDGELHPWTAS